MITNYVKARGEFKNQNYKTRAREARDLRDGQEFYYEKLRTMFEETKEEVKTLQIEHLACREENATLRTTVAQQGKEIDNLNKRIQLLESRTINS